MITRSANQPTVRIHQRKHSSSKTPSPPNVHAGPIAASTEAPTKDTQRATKENAEKRPTSRFGRRKAKDGLQNVVRKPGNELALHLPSVPSTSHVHPSGSLSVPDPSAPMLMNHVQDIHMSSFFSIHRPISLTTPIPHQSSNKTFSSIFDPKASARIKPSEVIYTLSSAVDSIENAATTTQSQDNQNVSPEEVDLRQAVMQASSSNSDQATNHRDLPAKTFHINLQELAKNFRPFVPPPVPVPLGKHTATSQSQFQGMQRQSQLGFQKAPSQKSYTTTLTIHEISYPNGQKVYKTHTTPIVEGPGSETSGNRIRYVPPIPYNQPFLGRMRQRQVRYLDRVFEKDGWMAISVKRQRKLKMKKHKYKKLMKRTKNLRRRLDRT